MRKKFPPKFDSVPSIFSLFFPLYNSPNDPNLSKGTLWKPKLKRRLFPESAFIFSRSLPSNEFYYWPQFSSRLLFSSQVCNLLGNLTKFKAEWGGGGQLRQTNIPSRRGSQSPGAFTRQKHHRGPVVGAILSQLMRTLYLAYPRLIK